MKLIAASTALFIGLMGVYTVPLQIGVFIDGKGIAAANAGYLGSVELAALSIVTMLLGLAISRISLVKLAVTGVLISATAQIITVLLTDIYLLGLSRFMVGTGCGFVLAAATATIASSSDPDQFYGRAFACMSLAFGAWLIFLPYTTALISEDGIFIMLAGISILSLPLLRYLPATGSAAQNHASTETIDWTGVALLMLAITLVYIAYGGSYYFSERIGIDIGISRETIGLAYGISALTGFVGAGLVGWCSSRFKRTIPMVSAFIIIGLISLGIVFSSSQLEFMTVIILMNGAFMFAISYVMGTAAALDKLGRIAALAEGYVILAMSIGTAVFGFVAAGAGYATLAWPAFLFCCLGALVIIPLTRVLDRKEK
jgi:predicted MFS family arabinose efflux permease